jgi:hypothetical protein
MIDMNLLFDTHNVRARYDAVNNSTGMFEWLRTRH